MEFKNNSLITEEYIKKSFIYMKDKDNLKFDNIFNIEIIKKDILNNYKFQTKYSHSLYDNDIFIGIRKNFEIINNFKNDKYEFLYVKRIQTDNLNLLIKFLYLEIYLIIEKYNNRTIDLNELKEFIYTSLNINRKIYNKINSKNRNLLITNNSSFEYPIDEDNLYKYKEQIERIGLNMLEVPKTFKRNELGIFLNNLELLKENLKIKKFNFNLRIKRIKKYKKIGMFIVNANTIILDPREPNAIIHEIGHYIFENKLPFNIKNKRIYKNQFNNIIKKNKIKFIDDIKIYSKYEDYNIESEIFALWFENQII